MADRFRISNAMPDIASRARDNRVRSRVCSERFGSVEWMTALRGLVIGSFTLASACGHNAASPDAAGVDAVNDAPMAALFSPAVGFATGAYPQSVAVGDLNGDGNPDLAVANFNDNSVSVLLNTTAAGATTPSFSTKVDFTTGLGDLDSGSHPFFVAIGDLDGDGKLDLAVTDFNGGTVSVFINTTVANASTPSFATRVDLATWSPFENTSPYVVAIGDLNGDGRPDLVVAEGGEGTAMVMSNTTTPNATPSFTLDPIPLSSDIPFFTAISDINGDGNRDLVVTDLARGSVSVLLNPDFATDNVVATITKPYGLAIADFNGDSKPDLAIASADAHTLSVLLDTTIANAQTPSFSTQVDLPTGIDPESVAAADFDGDGKPDLAVANLNSDSVWVFLNTTATDASTPTFSSASSYETVSPCSIAVGDFNGDGKPDLAVANEGTNDVSILLAE